MNLLKYKALISLLTLLVFISQLTAMAMPCQMAMQNHSNNPSDVANLSVTISNSMNSMSMDHSAHQMPMTIDESSDESTKTAPSSMECCDNESDCSMGGCFSMLASFNLLSVNNPIVSQKIIQPLSIIINPVAVSLYRPPISL